MFSDLVGAKDRFYPRLTESARDAEEYKRAQGAAYESINESVFKSEKNAGESHEWGGREKDDEERVEQYKH
jgi:hypothetical protein